MTSSKPAQEKPNSLDFTLLLSVKLPLGIHRLSGKRSYFVNFHDRSIEAQKESAISKEYKNIFENLDDNDIYHSKKQSSEKRGRKR